MSSDSWPVWIYRYNPIYSTLGADYDVDVARVVEEAF